ncbi:MAG: hypothetical protein IT384_09705 [Deltaproteobacteria bacterium]|nr:hypothetical protein [Deltaproteobacteria bacterium]
MRASLTISLTLLAVAAVPLAFGPAPRAFGQALPEGEAPASTSAVSTSTSAGAGRFDHKAILDRLSERSDLLQGRIDQVGDRVRLLRESVVIGSIAPTRVLIVHRDELGASFTLDELTYRLDGNEVLATKTAAVTISVDQQDFEVFNGPMVAGAHEINVSMIFSGSGFGLFTYLKGYKFKVESKYRFNAAEGRLTKVSVIAYAKKDITLEPKDRLAIRYETDILALSSSGKSN